MVESSGKPTVEQKMFGERIKDTSPGALRELLEKNLKWSHIIYEQNRRLQNKMTWSLIIDLIRLSIIVVPLILGILFLPKVVKNYSSKYNVLNSLSSSSVSSTSTNQTIQDLLNTLNLNSEESEQLKNLLK